MLTQPRPALSRRGAARPRRRPAPRGLARRRRRPDRRRRARRRARQRLRQRRRNRLPVLRRAPGGHHDARPGPPALRRVRHGRGRHAATTSSSCCRTGRYAAVAHDPGARGHRGRRRRRLRRSLRPDDTGEALGLPASGLTITFGFGPTLFTDRRRRRPLRHRRPRPPELLDQAPPLPRRRAAAGARAAATSASRPAPTTRRWRCTRSATSAASPSAARRIRWSQLGFGRTSSTSTSAGDPAQPVRLQGRHRQHQGGGDEAGRRAGLGQRRRTARPGWPAAATS